MPLVSDVRLLMIVRNLHLLGAGGVVSDGLVEPGGLTAGSVVAGYRIESRIGTGGMAVVYRARDERLRRMVALKVLAPGWAEDEDFRRRFVAESLAAAAVHDPHIIPVHEAGEAEGVMFIAMHLVSGGDLKGIVRREGPLAPWRALDLLSPVASALDAVHAAGLVHRDVKPANILVDQQAGRPDHVYLSDFGLSKGAVSGVSLTGTGHYLGTPQYSSPEQVQGHPVDGRADQYALACVAFQILTGQVPFERDDGLALLLAHISALPPALSERRPGLATAADPVIARALAKKPEDRYPACRDFTDALRQALALPSYGRPAAVVIPQTASPVQLGGTGLAREQPREPTARASRNEEAPANAGTPPAGARAPAGGMGIPPAPAGAAAFAGSKGSTVDVAASPYALPGPAAPPVRPALTIRLRRRPVAITLACAVLAVIAAAVAIPLMLAGPGKITAMFTGALTDPAKDPVYLVALSLEGNALADGTGKGTISTIYLWNTTKHTITATLTAPVTPDGIGVTSMAFAPGGVLAAGDDNGNIYIWNSAGRLITTIPDPGSQGVESVAFSPDGATLASGDNNGNIYLWNTSTHKLITVLSDSSDDGPVYALAFGPEGALAAASGLHVRLWNTTTDKVTATSPAPITDIVTGVAFAPGGVVAATDSQGAYLWNPATGKPITYIPDPDSDPDNSAGWSLVFSPNGAILAVTGSAGSTYLWNTATGNPDSDRPVVIRGQSAAFSPSGTTLATGNGNAVDLWHITG